MKQATFADLGVSEVVVKELARRGISTPFAVQGMVIPDVLAGHDRSRTVAHRVGQDARVRRAARRDAEGLRRASVGADPRAHAGARDPDRR